MDWENFIRILKKFVKKDNIEADDALFGSGINISSIRFTEFIMTLEEEFDVDIDIDDLDASIKTVGQLFEHLTAA